MREYLSVLLIFLCLAFLETVKITLKFKPVTVKLPFGRLEVVHITVKTEVWPDILGFNCIYMLIFAPHFHNIVIVVISIYSISVFTACDGEIFLRFHVILKFLFNSKALNCFLSLASQYTNFEI